MTKDFPRGNYGIYLESLDRKYKLGHPYGKTNIKTVNSPKINE